MYPPFENSTTRTAIIKGLFLIQLYNNPIVQNPNVDCDERKICNYQKDCGPRGRCSVHKCICDKVSTKVSTKSDITDPPTERPTDSTTKDQTESPTELPTG